MLSYGNLLMEDYYNWLLEKIDDGRAKDYSILLENLFHTEFYAIVNNDENRIIDGLSLRAKFADEIGEHLYYVAEKLPDFCSVLEMMIALSIRIENDYLYDEEQGNRVFVWFWMMIDNLDLTDFDNKSFDLDKYLAKMDKFLARNFLKNGHGGLFLTKKTGVDMRKIEIWEQINYFLDDFL